MANLKNTSINDTGFLKVPSGNTAQRPAAEDGVIRYNTDGAKIEFYSSEYGGGWQDFTIPWFYRSIITNSYILGGYKSAVTYRRVNRTVHATDVTTDLGDQLDRTFNYKAGACGLDVAYVFGAANAHNAASNLTTAFNMRTEQQVVTPGNMDMANARGHMGTVFQEHYYTWIMGGGRGEIERFDTITENMSTRNIPGNPNYSGQGGNTAGGPWGMTCSETYGIFYSGNASGVVGQWNLTFATETLTTRSGPQPANHFQQKSIQSKIVNGYAGTNGSWSGGYSYRRTNFSTNTSSSGGVITKAYTNCGEENYSMGQDHQYMLGQYNGLQNNLSAKFVYATEVQTAGGSSMQPSGIPGTSSGICSWRD